MWFAREPDGQSPARSPPLLGCAGAGPHRRGAGDSYRGRERPPKGFSGEAPIERKMVRRLDALAAGMIACGVALLALSVLRGEGAAGVAVFIPFFYGTGPLASLGALLLFIGLFCLFLSILRPSDTFWRDSPEDGPEAGGASGGSGEGERAEEGEGRGAGVGGAGEGAEAARKLAAKDVWRAPGEESRRGAGEKPRTGAVVLIGPVPIVYGSDPGVARWMLVLATALALALFSLLLIFLLVRRL